MDFFAHQDKARKKSFQLVVLFSLAVVFIVVAVYLAIMGVMYFASGKMSEVGPETIPFEWFNFEVFYTVAIIVGAAIGVATLMKILALRQGGSYVAEALGGTLVQPDSTDSLERRLLNVVEEISIAAGVPVPAVYVMKKERGINAFAAGWSPSDAAVAVTAGCLEQLNRDELQGVIAHEFSHILNGDMRLNIRLIGFISGIMVLATIGYWALHMRPSTRGKNNGYAAILLAAIALLIIGYGGAFVARLIQSAVSRQREFLADSSAVQFTRNPSGIANALKKIGGYEIHSTIHSPASREVRHMFFGPSDVVSMLGSVLATHPPIDERIKRLDPSFDGDYSKRSVLPDLQAPEAAAGQAGVAGMVGAAAFGSAGASARAVSSGSPTLPTSAESVAGMGVLTQEHIDAGAALLAAIPDRLRQGVSEPMSACATIAALLLDSDPDVRSRQLESVAREFSPALARETGLVAKDVASIDPAFRLPLVDLALPALRRLSRPQYAAFSRTLIELVRADENVTLFEFCLQKVVEFRLFQAFDAASRGYRAVSPREFIGDAVVLLSAVARAGSSVEDDARRSFEAAVSTLFMGRVPAGVGPLQKPGIDQLDQAFQRFSMAPMKIRRQVFLAVSDCVLHDGHVTVQESELIRAVAYCMGLPLPPFVVGRAA